MDRKLIIISLAALAIIITFQGEESTPSGVLINYQIEATSLDSQVSLLQNNQLVLNIPEPPPNLNLQSALVKNLGTNFYFLEVNINQRWPLASLTKLLTAVTAFEKLENTRETINKIKVMIITSSNETAEELADLYGKDEFIKAMRLKAKELAMDNTSIYDVSGLSFLNQSTVKDLEKLVDHIAKNYPQILQFSRQTFVTVGGRELASTNRFAGLPNFMGGKTGYTDEASGNLVSIFQHRGQPILIIVLGTADKAGRFEQTNILFQWISKFYK